MLFMISFHSLPSPNCIFASKDIRVLVFFLEYQAAYERGWGGRAFIYSRSQGQWLGLSLRSIYPATEKHHRDVIPGPDYWAMTEHTFGILL